MTLSPFAQLLRLESGKESSDGRITVGVPGRLVADDDEEQRGIVREAGGVVADEAELANLLRKKFTRDRVVPIISACVSCETADNTRRGYRFGRSY